MTATNRLAAAVSLLPERPRVPYEQMLAELTANLRAMVGAVQGEPAVMASPTMLAALRRASSFVAWSESTQASATPGKVYEASALCDELLLMLTRTVRMGPDGHGADMMAMVREGRAMALEVRRVLYLDGFRGGR